MTDMRHDKYLHSVAWWERRIAWLMENPHAPFPKEWTDEPKEKPKPLKHVSARRQAHTYRGFHDAEFRKYRFADRRAARKKAALDFPLHPLSEAKRGSHRECARRLRQAGSAP